MADRENRKRHKPVKIANTGNGSRRKKSSNTIARIYSVDRYAGSKSEKFYSEV